MPCLHFRKRTFFNRNLTEKINVIDENCSIAFYTGTKNKNRISDLNQFNENNVDLNFCKWQKSIFLVYCRALAPAAYLSLTYKPLVEFQESFPISFIFKFPNNSFNQSMILKILSAVT